MEVIKVDPKKKKGYFNSFEWTHDQCGATLKIEYGDVFRDSVSDMGRITSVVWVKCGHCNCPAELVAVTLYDSRGEEISVLDLPAKERYSPMSYRD